MTDEERRMKSALDVMSLEQVKVLWHWWTRYYLDRITAPYRGKR